MNPSQYTYEEPVEGGFTVLEEGEYPFVVLEMSDIIQSKKGNFMVEVLAQVTDPDDGCKADLKDFLVFSDKAKWKVDAFLKCLSGGNIEPGRKIDFASQDFRNWCYTRKCGRCKVVIEQFKGKDGTMKDGNRIGGYLYEKSEKAAPKPAPMPMAVPDDVIDDVPF